MPLFGRPQAPKDSGKIRALRTEVMKQLYIEQYDIGTSEAYRALFTYLGLAVIANLINDGDTSIALQAAWETHRKTVPADSPSRDTEPVGVDQNLMKKFVRFVAKRLGTEPPDWWQDAFLNVVVFTGRYYAFSKIVASLPEHAKVTQKSTGISVATGKTTIRIPIERIPPHELIKQLCDMGAEVTRWLAARSAANRTETDHARRFFFCLLRPWCAYRC